MLDNTPNQPTKFKTKNWVAINDESHGVHNTVKLKTSMLRSIFCDYSDSYILVSGTITIPNTGTVANPNNRKKR